MGACSKSNFSRFRVVRNHLWTRRNSQITSSVSSTWCVVSKWHLSCISASLSHITLTPQTWLPNRCKSSILPKIQGKKTSNCRKVPKCCLKHDLNLFWRIGNGFWNSAHLHSNFWVVFRFFSLRDQKSSFLLNISTQSPTFKFLAIMAQSITFRDVSHICKDVTNQALTQTRF